MNRATLKPRQAALRDFAVRLTRRPSAMRHADVRRLRNVGLDDEGILDAIQVIAFFNYINRIADAVGIDSEPQWSDRPAGWKKPARPRRSTLHVARSASAAWRRRM